MAEAPKKRTRKAARRVKDYLSHEPRETLFHVTAAPLPNPAVHSLARSARALHLDHAHYDPSSTLARDLFAKLQAHEKRARADNPAEEDNEEEHPRLMSLEAVLELLEAEREEVDMPVGYPSSDLLAGLHAHTAEYYDSLGCNRGPLDTKVARAARADTFEEDRRLLALPSMTRKFQPSALVALGILVQENVRYQLATAYGQLRAPKGSGKRSAKPKHADDSAPGKGRGRKRKLQEAQEA